MTVSMMFLCCISSRSAGVASPCGADGRFEFLSLICRATDISGRRRVGDDVFWDIFRGDAILDADGCRGA